MNKQEVLRKIKSVGVIPVVRTDSADKARRVVGALVEGGIDVLEITMTIPNAVELIAELTSEYGASALVGAGTVLDAESARRLVDESGAQFIVSPITDHETIAFCKERGVLVMPGALTPTEIFAAHSLGADVVKVFPANSMGGAAYLKSVKAVFPHVEIVPTGGVNPENAHEYLKAGALAVGIGGELVKGDAREIIDRARRLTSEISAK